MSVILLIVVACLLAAILVVLVRCAHILAEINESCKAASVEQTCETARSVVLEAVASESLSAGNTALRDAARSASLTKRETDILAYVYRGWKAKAIGEELYLSEATVKSHMGSIYRKFKVHSQQEIIAVIDARRSGKHEWIALCDN